MINSLHPKQVPLSIQERDQRLCLKCCYFVCHMCIEQGMPKNGKRITLLRVLRCWGSLGFDLMVQLSGAWAFGRIFGRPWWRPGPSVGGMGCRLHSVRPLWRPLVWVVVCILGGPGGDLGVQLSGVWAVVCISGGLRGGLGVQLSRLSVGSLGVLGAPTFGFGV